MYEVTVVHGAGKRKVMWSGPEIIVMIALGRKKSIEYVLLEAQGAAEQRVIIVLDKLSCCWPVSWEQTSPESTTNDSFGFVIGKSRVRPPVYALPRNKLGQILSLPLIMSAISAST